MFNKRGEAASSSSDKPSAQVWVSSVDSNGRKRIQRIAELTTTGLYQIGPSGIVNIDAADKDPQQKRKSISGRLCAFLEEEKSDQKRACLSSGDCTVHESLFPESLIIRKHQRDYEELLESTLDVKIFRRSSPITTYERQKVRIPNIEQGRRYSEEQISSVYEQLRPMLRRLRADEYGPELQAHKQELEYLVIDCFGEKIIKLDPQINRETYQDWKKQRIKEIRQKRSENRMLSSNDKVRKRRIKKGMFAATIALVCYQGVQSMLCTNPIYTKPAAPEQSPESGYERSMLDYHQEYGLTTPDILPFESQTPHLVFLDDYPKELVQSEVAPVQSSLQSLVAQKEENYRR